MKNKYVYTMLIVLGLIGSCTNDDEATPSIPEVLTVSINPSENQEEFTDEDSAEFTVVFSVAIDPSTFTSDDISLDGTNGSVTSSPSTTDNITWNFTVTGMEIGDKVSATLRAGVVANTNGDTNKASFFTTKTVTYARVTVTLDQAVAQMDPTNMDLAVFTVVFSEAIDPSTFTADDIKLSGTTGTVTTGPTSTDNITWNFTVTGMTDTDTIVATLAENTVTAATGIGNEASTSTDNKVTYDSSISFSITVTIDQAVGQVDPTDIDAIEFTVVFSEAIDPSTFTADDITLSGTTGTVTTGPTSTDNITWNFTVTGMSEADLVTATLASDIVANLGGTTNDASTSTDNNVRYTTDIACGVNAYVWEGVLSHDAGATDAFGPYGDPFNVTATVTSCGELAISSTVVDESTDSDVALFFCEAGTQTINLVLTPDFDGATTGTVTIARQAYENCTSFSVNEVAGDGTYDETTGVLSLQISPIFDGFVSDPIAIILTTK